MDLNLAGNPFRNLRPLRRVAILLSVLGLILAALDARTYWRHFTGENQTRVKLQELDAELAAERDALARLQGDLSRLDVEALNQRAVFVNDQISQRVFSWSGLFDDLVAILPLQAQLVSLEPQFGRDSRSRRNLELREGEVMLEIDGVARDTPRLLTLIDRFFGHASFREPDLEREAQKESWIDFTLKVIYHPGVGEVPDPAAASGDPGSTDGATETTDGADAKVEPEEEA